MKRVINWLLVATSVAFILYQLTSTQYLLQDPVDHKITHLGFAFLVIFLTSFLARTSKYRYLLLALALVSVAFIAYIRIFSLDLQLRGSVFPTDLEIVIGIAVIICSFVAVWQRWGLVLPIVALLFLGYAALGPYLPAPFTTGRVDLWEWVAHLSIGFGDVGAFGPLLAISASQIFLFMVFAALVQTTGAIEFFSQLGKLSARYTRAGPAMAAVVTSALVGSVSGAAAANVAITGSFTIPAMKEAGYKPEQAGAIEAAASTGGPIIPPVMGIAAFVMAGVTGIPYSKIIGVAVLPALFYMISCAFYVTFQASKLNLTPSREEVDYREMLLRSILFIVPLATIIVLFLMGFSTQYVSFWAVISILILSFLRRQTRLTREGLKESFVIGARIGSEVAVITTILGIMIATVTKTGLGIRIPLLVEGFAGENLLSIMILTGIVSLILGIGLPASAAYVLVSLTIAPVLVKMGVPLLAAHLYVFYFAIFSFLTPPVALSALFASRLAESNFMKTAIESTKVGVAGFVLPFALVWCPAFVWIFDDPLFSVTGIIATIIILVLLQASMVGYGLVRLRALERFILVATAFIFVVHLYTTATIWFIAGAGVFIAMILQQLARQKRHHHLLTKVSG